MLEPYLRDRLKSRDILLMTHVVLGYPSLAASREIVAAMVEAGVDLVELQIPFSEPIADGPVILHANQRALAAGVTVEACFEIAAELCRSHPIPFLFMSYYNILFRRGVGAFVEQARAAGVRGLIVPDLPPEEGPEYWQATQRAAVEPILIFSPRTSEQRLRYLAERASGFVYCVARKGVTGSRTSFSSELEQYLQRCRRATQLPLAVGFGVKDAADVAFLRGKADIAVVGSETIKRLDQYGVGGVLEFVKKLRG